MIQGAPEGIVGLGLFAAQRRLRHAGIQKWTISYMESERPFSTVLQVREKHGDPHLVVASRNPIRFLPSIYQDNEFLRNFLWVFQHLYNEITLTLDNLHSFFVPSDTPEGFLRWLAGWFDISIAQVLPEDKLRLLLHQAVTLYRYRGTAIGIQKLMKLLTGVEPEILENYLPHDAYVLGASPGNRAALILDSKKQYRAYFTVFFPIERAEVDPGVVTLLPQILEMEKPANTLAIIAFRNPEEVKVLGVLIDDDTRMASDESVPETGGDKE
ncbi:phage tail protein domain-containing protein [Alkalispirochaeta americana]|uniref:Phage tail protein domain-containing protein n=1 Tax=Alkalispirochaeta americana TaxID=159291 RepID=A0A1N6X8I0_9SPIO|nr:phage tail protein [Alkalispirochaeta americana]SIQ98662.1 phage tail protein domain-containing protein [Alkalispirochaeta americana]